jgi:hypothetical protein
MLRSKEHPYSHRPFAFDVDAAVRLKQEAPVELPLGRRRDLTL